MAKVIIGGQLFDGVSDALVPNAGIVVRQGLLHEVGANLAGRDLSRAQVVRDRALAIDAALDDARPGDAVLIAGKGHEDYQIIGREKLPFSDAEEARRALRRRAA